MSKEKTIIDKIVDLVSTKQPEIQKHSDDGVTVDTSIDNVIAKERWVYLPDGLYTLEDGSNFRVASNMIVEVNEAKSADTTSTPDSTASTASTDEQSAQTPEKDEHSEKFSAFETKLLNFESAINKLNEFETKLSSIEKAVAIIGSKSSGTPIQRTESMEKATSSTSLREYFTNEKDYQSFIKRNKN